MEKCLIKYNLLKLNQEEIENKNRPVSSMEIKIVMKNIFQKPRARWLHMQSLPEVCRRANTYIAYSKPSRKFQRKDNSQTHSTVLPSP